MHADAEKFRGILVRFAEELKSASPSGGMPTASDRDPILEIGCLTMAIDGDVDKTELAVFRIAAGEIGRICTGAGQDFSEEAALSLVTRHTESHDRDAVLERLRVLADGLSGTAARELAYAAAYLLTLADLNMSDREFEFEIDLEDALGVVGKRAEAIAAGVSEALCIT